MQGHETEKEGVQDTGCPAPDLRTAVRVRGRIRIRQRGDVNRTRFYVLAAEARKPWRLTNEVFTAACGAGRIDDIIVEIRKSGAELVTIHDRPEGSRLGTYHYIIEVKDGAGLSEKALEKIDAIPEVRCLGSFDVAEKTGSAMPD